MYTVHYYTCASTYIYSSSYTVHNIIHVATYIDVYSLLVRFGGAPFASVERKEMTIMIIYYNSS